MEAPHKFQMPVAPDKYRMVAVRDALIWISIALFPVFFLTIRGWTNGFLFLLFLVSMTCLHDLSDSRRNKSPDNYSLILIAALGSGCFAVLASQALRGEFSWHPYDTPSRLLLAIPIFLVLKQKEINFLRVFQYAGPVSLLIAVLSTWFFPHTWNGRPGSYFADPITFGNYSLVLGFMSLFSLNLLEKDSRLLAALKLAGFASGIYLSIHTQSRSGWVAAPVLILIWLIAYRGPISRGGRFVIAGLGMACIVLAYFGLDFVHTRVNDAASNVIAWFSDKDRTTPIGMRLSMWRIAFTLFFESPIHGYGDQGYWRALDSNPFILAYVSALARFTMHGGLHNDMLAGMVRYGIFGLTSILSLFLVPFFIFLHNLKSMIPRVHGASVLGLTFVTGLFVSSFGEQVLYLTFLSAFYGLMITSLCATALWKPRQA